LFRYADPGNLDSGSIDATRPLNGYQDLAIAQHMLYQNYNAMQITWIRTRGRYNVNLNYSLGKSLGLVGAYDEFNLRNNYGAMPNDRRHVFNAAYSIELPDAIQSNGSRIAKGVLNGWQLSGVTQIQSGVNLTANTGGNFNLDVNGARLANGQNLSSATIFGTPSIALRPVLSCDPGTVSGSQRFINETCFSLPTGRFQTGGTVLPE